MRLKIKEEEEKSATPACVIEKVHTVLYAGTQQVNDSFSKEDMGMMGQRS